MIFGTDGVRDIGGEGLLSPDSVDRFGSAILQHLQREGISSPRILIGRDTRESGPEIELQLTRSLKRGPVETLHAGVVPTPALSVLLAAGHADLGLMISASHNPPEFNGIKVLDHKGEKLSKESEKRISEDHATALPLSGEFPTLTEDPGWGQIYLNALLDSFPEGDFLKGLEVVLDLARGAACQWAPEAFRRAGAKVHLLHAEPDGTRINVGCGSLHPKVLADEVIHRGADLGVAFDGDADRALFCDHAGRSLDGDDVIALWALDLKSRDELKPEIVALTVMSNMGVEKYLSDHGIEVLRTPVGDREVANALRESGGVLGGETSGHIIHLSEAATGDGIRTGLAVCRCLADSGRTLAEHGDKFQRFPLQQRTLRIENRPEFDSLTILQVALKEAEEQLARNGRLVVRFSGTEPLLRILVEAVTEDSAHYWVEKILEAACQEESLGSITVVA